MRTTQQRIDKYNAKVDSSHYGALMVAVLPLAKGNFAAAANTLEVIEAQALQILGEEGVMRIHYGGYLACLNQCWRMKLSGTGSSWQLACLVILNVWVARGLTQSVLEELLSVVLGWSAPSAW